MQNSLKKHEICQGPFAESSALSSDETDTGLSLSETKKQVAQHLLFKCADIFLHHKSTSLIENLHN